jgi:hypothetical protein
MEVNKVLDIIDHWIDNEYKNLDLLEQMDVSPESRERQTAFIEGILHGLESLYGRIKGELEQEQQLVEE